MTTATIAPAKKREPTPYEALKRDVQNLTDASGNPIDVFTPDNGVFLKKLSLRILGLVLITILHFIAVVVLTTNWTIVTDVVLAIPFGVLMTQIALCAHDVGHHSALTNKKTERGLGVFLGNVLLAVSHSWWGGKHNQHHETPNQEDEDPDVKIPIAVFDEDHATSRGRFVQHILRNQHIFAIPLFSLQALNTQILGTYPYLWTESRKYFQSKKSPAIRALKPQDLMVQWATTTLHWVTVASLWWLSGLVVGAVFFFAYMLVHGLSNSSIFAPNHKGMEIIKKGAKVGRFYMQVVTSRNVSGGKLVEFWYGNLRYQIEHHLFPQIPSHKIHLIAPLVEKHCKINNLAYTSMSARASYGQIGGSLKEVALKLREKHSEEKRLAKVA